MDGDRVNASIFAARLPPHEPGGDLTVATDYP
jgi:hypothetical protein